MQYRPNTPQVMSQGCQSRSSGPFFPVQLLIRVLRCAIVIIAHRNTLEERESRPPG
jgi:hypothetical protein